MFNPFQFMSDSFEGQYRVHFSTVRQDGSVLLSLVGEGGVVVRRALTSEQLADYDKLVRMVRSIRFGLAIESGRGISCLNELSEPAANDACASSATDPDSK
jgi:hypothetical protein